MLPRHNCLGTDVTRFPCPQQRTSLPLQRRCFVQLSAREARSYWTLRVSNSLIVMVLRNHHYHSCLNGQQFSTTITPRHRLSPSIDNQIKPSPLLLQLQHLHCLVAHHGQTQSHLDEVVPPQQQDRTLRTTQPAQSVPTFRFKSRALNLWSHLLPHVFAALSSREPLSFVSPIVHLYDSVGSFPLADRQVCVWCRARLDGNADD